jgi:hypothetical protein
MTRRTFPVSAEPASLPAWRNEALRRQGEPEPSMKTSTQPERGPSIWTSRRFDQRVEFDAGELRRQPDFAPPRESQKSDGYARHFYGDRAAPSQQGSSADEGLSDVVARPRHGSPARKAAPPLRRRA